MRKKQLHLFFFCCKIWKILTRINSIFCNLNEASKTNPVFYNFCSFCIRFWSCFEVVTKWRWLFHQRVVGKKIWFFPPEASIGRMIKPLGMRRLQTCSSKSTMFDYTCDEHVVKTRWLKAKNCQKTLIFRLKINVFWPFFAFSQRVLTTCSSHV